MTKRKHQVLENNASHASSAIKTPFSNDTNATDEESKADWAKHFRRIKAHKGYSDDEALSDSSNMDSSPGPGRHVVVEGDSDSSAVLESVESDQSNTEGETDDKGVDSVAEISFGALAKAQAKMEKSEPSNHDRLTTGARVAGDPEALERKAGKKDHRDFTRSSKHAPTEHSSKKAVSRKRSVVPLQNVKVRDPRFEPAVGKVDQGKVKQHYSFLSEYRDKEIAELKAGIRKSKDVKAKETMQQALKSMESRKRTQELKDQRQEVLRRHRKHETAKVQEGKKPFYLKKSDIKNRALEERLQGMKAKERGKAIERRRKKFTAKERKQMPDARRA